MSLRARVLGVCTLLIGLGAAHARADLHADIEPGVIDELDTATLTIQHSGTSRVLNLELDALLDDFEVLGTQSASQYRSMNGRLESSVEYQIRLRPRRTGDITIPPLAVGDEQTPPLHLSVRGVEPDVRDTIGRMVFFETELEGAPVYVQGQAVLIRRLYYTSGAQIYSDLPGLPEVEGAVVQPLGETTSRTEERDGRRYGVIEQRFAIFPERSGTLTVPAISVTSSVRLQLGGRIRRTGIRIGTEPLTLEVLPIPAEYPEDQPWLPANNVELRDHWSPEQSQYHVGEPVERRVEVHVTGNVASIIPTLDAPLPDAAFRQYPEPPKLENRGRGAGFAGVRHQRFAIVPQTGGAVTVPPLAVTWWDVDEARVRVAESPARSLQILGGAPARSAPGPATGNPSEAPLGLDEPAREPGATSARGVLIALLALTVALALGWLLRDRWPSLRPELRAQTDASGRFQALQHACRGNDAGRMHAALVDYLAAHYATSPPRALVRFRAAGHGELLDRLNAAAFGRNGEVPDGREIIAAARELHPARRARLRRGARGIDPALPELYS